MTEYKQYQLTKYLEVGAAPNEKTLTIATVKTPELQDGDVLLKIEYLSVDPYMRGRMTDGVQIMECFPLNTDVPTLGLGQVVESKNEKIKSVKNFF
jgi:NADPH-dependent curcumin reductase